MTSSQLLTVNNLTVDLLTARTAVRPVDGVSYSLSRGETLAIVGESGSGKTVMNFAPLGLLPIGVEADMSGSVSFDGQELIGASSGRRSETGHPSWSSADFRRDRLQHSG